MAALGAIRKAAREAGVPANALRGLTTEAEIQAVIDRHTGKARPVKKAAVAKKAVASKTRTTRTASRTAARGKTTAKAATKTTARNSRTKTTATKTTAAKRTTTAARGRTATKTTTKRTANSNGGRNLLEDIDWTETEGWNPREGSAPDLILRALRKAKGDREKAFNALVVNLWDFVKKTDSNGRKRSKAEAEWQLRYRISRTAWDFAKRTGQHEPSTNRATYGEGGTGIGVSGGMPVQFRPDDFDGKPVFKRAKKTTARKAAGASRTAAKTTAKAKPKTATRTRTAARTAAQKRTATKTTTTRRTTARKTTTRGRK